MPLAHICCSWGPHEGVTGKVCLFVLSGHYQLDNAWSVYVEHLTLIILKQGVAATRPWCNRTVPPCSVGRWTGQAPGLVAADHPRVLQTKTDDSVQNNTGQLAWAGNDKQSFTLSQRDITRWVILETVEHTSGYVNRYSAEDFDDYHLALWWRKLSLGWIRKRVTRLQVQLMVVMVSAAHLSKYRWSWIALDYIQAAEKPVSRHY